MRRIRVGVVGCGVISGIYLENMTTRFKELEVAACADLLIGKAREAAERFNIPKYCGPQELLADPSIELVVNLTIPAAHFELNMAALEAGKHIYCEKPLAMTFAQGQQIMAKAAAKGLLVGCAPDTFMGSGLQTCRKALDEGWIGRPLAVTANLVCHGHEAWHPAPEFYYKKGAGPMMDMGPYYLTALVSMLGPISRTTCYAGRFFDRRTISSTSPLKGKIIDVEVLTHYAGLIEFKSGVIANINMSFDIWQSNLPGIEIHGTEGSMIVPDPNWFDGAVRILRGENMLDAVDGLPVDDAVEKFYSPEIKAMFKEMPIPYRQAHNLRGLGVQDLACAIISGRRPRADGAMACHVLEALTSFDQVAANGGDCQLQSTCERPEPLTAGLDIGDLTQA